MSVETIPFDGTEFMGTPEAQAYLIADAMESGDPVYVRHALNTIARARGMTQIANEAGVAREALYRALSPDGDPRMSTLFGVLNALGLRMSVTPTVPLASASVSILAGVAAMLPADAAKLRGGEKAADMDEHSSSKPANMGVEHSGSKKAKGARRHGASAA